MTHRMNDEERARSLGMTLEQFQRLIGFDPLDTHVEFVKSGHVGPYDNLKPKPKKKKDKMNDKAKSAEECGYSLHDEMSDINGIGDGTMVPFETDEDVKNKNAREIEHYWDKPITTLEDKALYYGYHIHTKDNVYGLHAHYPGGPLGGGHLHGPQNRLGYHTHRYNQEELLQFKFARPGVMIQLDGPHVHQHLAPDGKHVHCEENFGPANS